MNDMMLMYSVSSGVDDYDDGGVEDIWMVMTMQSVPHFLEYFGKYGRLVAKHQDTVPVLLWYSPFILLNDSLAISSIVFLWYDFEQHTHHSLE